MFTLLFLLALAIGLSWFWAGWKKIPVGYRGLQLFFGKRRHQEYPEGWRWIPLPFDVKIADCRQIILKLDKLEAITRDNLSVTTGSTVVYKIVDLYKFFDIENLETGIDQSRTAVLRSKIRGKSQSEVLDLHEELSKDVKDALEHEDWGVDILEVIIPEISPDMETAKNLALKKHEELQAEGQTVEIQLFIDKVNKLMTPPPTGAGLSREQAVEQVQLAIGKASKTVDAKTITLDPVTAALIAEALRRK